MSDLFITKDPNEGTWVREYLLKVTSLTPFPEFTTRFKRAEGNLKCQIASIGAIHILIKLTGLEWCNINFLCFYIKKESGSCVQ